MTRIYTVTLAPDQETWEANEAEHLLKQTYDEYLVEKRILTESTVVKLFKTGRVRSVTYAGTMTDDA